MFSLLSARKTLLLYSFSIKLASDDLYERPRNKPNGMAYSPSNDLFNLDQHVVKPRSPPTALRKNDISKLTVSEGSGQSKWMAKLVRIFDKAMIVLLI